MAKQRQRITYRSRYPIIGNDQSKAWTYEINLKTLFFICPRYRRTNSIATFKTSMAFRRRCETQVQAYNMRSAQK